MPPRKRPGKRPWGTLANPSPEELVLFKQGFRRITPHKITRALRQPRGPGPSLGSQEILWRTLYLQRLASRLALEDVGVTATQFIGAADRAITRSFAYQQLSWGKPHSVQNARKALAVLLGKKYEKYNRLRAAYYQKLWTHVNMRPHT